MVIARLGYDPFSATASRVVLTTVEQNGDELRARVDLANAEGSVQGVRELNAPAVDCTSLMRAVALSISIAIDPASALVKHEAVSNSEPESGDEDLSRAAANPEEELPLAPAYSVPVASRRRKIRYFAGAGLHVTAGAAPTFGYGGDLIFGGRYRGFSLSFEGRADPLNMTKADWGGEFGALFMLASVVPCVHSSGVSLCGLGSVGFIRAASQNITVRSSDTGMYAAVGARVGFQLPLTESFVFGIHADLAAPLPRQAIQITDIQTKRLLSWTTPSVFGLVGMHLLVHY